MATTIKLKNGSGAPTAGDLVQGEPAIDLTNKRLYTEDSGGSVIEVGSNPSSLSIAGTAVTATATELNILDGITSTTAELNILDGVTATAAELNVLDGVTAFVDEDDMSSDSATSIPSQQSVKAYVDAQVTASDLDFQGDSGGALSIDLDSETLTIAGGTGIDTSGATNTLTVAIDSTVTTLTGTQTLTNKTLTSPVISSISNTGTLTLPTSTDTLVGRATTDTLTNKTLTSAVLNTGVSGTAVLDEDDMSSDSATQLATQQSIKAYVDTSVSGIVTDSGTQTLTNKTLTSPVINTGVSGTAVLDDDTFATASATTLATSESIKAYVDAQIDTADQLSELSDVNITTPADGALLFYDTTTSKWIDNVVSGDVTIADTGVAAISSGVIVNDDINASAAISVSKTALVDGTGLTLTGDTLAVDASQTQITAVGTIGTGTWQGTVISDTYVANDLTISGGSIENTIIGASTPAAGTFTTFTSTGIDDNATSNAITIDSNENVGIGETSPSRPLDVSGNGPLRLNTTGNNHIVYALSGTTTGQFVSTSALPHQFTDSTGSTSRMSITSNGNVLIGRTDETLGGGNGEDLQIGSGGGGAGLTIHSNSASNGDIQFADGTTGDASYRGLIRYLHGQDAFSVWASGAEKIRLDSSGNLGIGTTIPSSYSFASELVVDTGVAGGITVVSDSTSGGYGALYFADGTTGNEMFRGFIQYNHNNSGTDEMLIGSAGVTRVTIDSDGYTGINTASPEMRLHVAENNSGGTTDVARFSNSQMSSSFNAGAKIYIGDDTLASRQLELSLEGNGSSEFYAFLRTKEPNGLLALGNANDAYAVTLDSNGDLGVGNSNPLARLHITQTEAVVGETDPLVRFERFTTGDNHYLDIGVDNSNNLVSFKSTGSSDGGFTFEGSSTEHLRIDSTGNIGIGQDSPSYKLHIKDVATNPILALQSSTTGTAFIFMGDTSDVDAARIAYDNNNNLMYFSVNGNQEAMRIDSSGYVGIGTSSPITHLNVNSGGSPAATYGVANFAGGTSADTYLTLSRGGADEGGIKILRGSVADMSIYVNSAENSIIQYNGGDTADNLIFRSGSAGTERVRFDNNGDVLVGNTLGALGLISTTTTEGFGIDADETYVAISRSNNGAALYLNKPGESTATAGDFIQCRQNGTNIGEIQYDGADLAIVQVSDQRLKNNIVDSASAGSIIDAMQVRSFDWNDGAHVDYGFVAQELNQAYEPATKVGGDDVDEEPWGIKTQKLIPLLVKEIQDLRARVAQLEGA